MYLVNSSGTRVASYTYDPYGKVDTATGTMAAINPLRYRGYYYDTETGFYYLQSRYYDPLTCRFINADDTSNLAANGDFTSFNLFAYCGNNPVNSIDPSGEAWWHWAIGAAIVVGFAALTVATCGGSLALAATSVGLVGSGIAAGTTATTVAASAFIGSATAYGVAALSAASTSNSIQEFNEQGNWGTVAAVAAGGGLGGYGGYTMSKSQAPTATSTGETQSTGLHTSGVGKPDNNVNPGGSYTKLGNDGKLYSYTQYDEMGRQAMRIDFQGRSHAGVLPHIHLFVYPQRAGRAEYIFDLQWRLIN